MDKIGYCFHPFQGRAPFGQLYSSVPINLWFELFPSLSGKTSIRTTLGCGHKQRRAEVVSIPFREDLHSDLRLRDRQKPLRSIRFPSLSGKSSIRTKRKPSQSTTLNRKSFHPFQGRPLFGHFFDMDPRRGNLKEFPSLSGKTSIRT